MAHLAKILYDSGVIPIVSTVSPNQSSREFEDHYFYGDFIEVIEYFGRVYKKRCKDLYKSDKKIKT